MKNYVFGLALFAVSLVSSISMAGDEARPDISPAHSSDNDSALNKVPEKARARVNPFRNDPDAVVAGQILFEDHCLACHGPEGVRGKKGPNLREPEVQNATSGTLFWLLTNGVAWKGMPVWAKLPPAQRWQLVSYLKSLGAKDGVNASESP